jgi:hypothetical protein
MAQMQQLLHCSYTLEHWNKELHHELALLQKWGYLQKVK